jgi:DNA repair exonuclease SbcCD ATPase subunit
MRAVRAEVLELVFAAAVVVVFASAAAAVADRVSRRTLTLLAGVVAAAALGAWVVFALGPSRELAVAAGGLTVCAALEGATIVLQRLLARARRLDDQLQEAETRFDKVVSAEADARAAELERTLARARADSLSKLVAEERKIGEERRLALEERERRASAELSEALARVEQRVAHRLAELSTDLERTEQALSTQLKTLGDRQKQLMSQAESRLVLETERLDAASEAQRERLSTLDTQFTTTADEIAQSGQAELESHERDRRRALHEVAERLRQRERELRERIAAEEAEAIQRIQAGFADIERRQLDQLKRVVERTAESFSDAVSKQFADTIRNARDDAAQRLSRELDRAVQHFAKEAQNVLAERLAHVADAGGQRLERKLSQIGTTLEHERDELMADLQRRIADAEVELRSQVQTLAADAEAERTVLNARLQDLQRRIDETLAEAGSRLAPTFRER